MEIRSEILEEDVRKVRSCIFCILYTVYIHYCTSISYVFDVFFILSNVEIIWNKNRNRNRNRNYTSHEEDRSDNDNDNGPDGSDGSDGPDGSDVSDVSVPLTMTMRIPHYLLIIHCIIRRYFNIPTSYH